MKKARSWKIILNINERNKKLETHSPSGYAKVLVASIYVANDIVSMMNNATYISEHEVSI